MLSETGLRYGLRVEESALVFLLKRNNWFIEQMNEGVDLSPVSMRDKRKNHKLMFIRPPAALHSEWNSSLVFYAGIKDPSRNPMRKLFTPNSWLDFPARHMTSLQWNESHKLFVNRQLPGKVWRIFLFQLREVRFSLLDCNLKYKSRKSWWVWFIRLIPLLFLLKYIATSTIFAHWGDSVLKFVVT